ncbi:MAG: thiol peroxidase [Chlamydiia bacterium]|nr:thiol peroxidase [Chlamydiia bacterium]MCP5508959.1 thiol peroxidase [Chlamydiales bacterium]
MAKTKLKGSPVTLSGRCLEVGQRAPDFQLVKQDLSELELTAIKEPYKVLSIFPSLDTDVCAKAIHTFYEKAKQHTNAVILNISMDLPFAAKRFCGAEHLNVITLSAFRSPFGMDYGLHIADGPLKGLLARAVIVLDPSNQVIYLELVPEITQEPNYDAALDAIR